MKMQRFTLPILMAFLILFVAACDSYDDDEPNLPDNEGTENPGGENPGEETSENDVFVLGLGVTTATETTNFVVQVEDLMNGTINLEGQGILQEGYRDYAYGGERFYSIGGLGVTDVNVFTVNDEDTLEETADFTLEFQNDGFRDVDGAGETMLGVSAPQRADISENLQFYTVDIATNTLANKTSIPFDIVRPTQDDWIFHTGMQVSGEKLYQTFYPVDNTTFATQNTDTLYVAVYSYPEFEFETLMKDTRTGPAGAFNTRSGIFTTENGDLYTVSTSSYTNGYSQSTKPAGILRIPAGSTEFDTEYFFNTDTANDGGKIAHAIYIGDGKLFAALTVQEPTIDDRWSDAYLRLAIVDLNAQTITRVANAPQFTGNGGRSFAAFEDDGKVYTAIADEAGVVNIYQTDVATATAVKGAQVQASFVGGIAKLD